MSRGGLLRQRAPGISKRPLTLLYAALIAGSLAACDPSSQEAPGGDLAVLAASAEGFRQASPGTSLVFPRDHGAHEDYRIEWWYLTANLEDDSGRSFGAQWTLFRIAANPPDRTDDEVNPWQDPQVFMAHFAISTPDEHFSFQRYARGGVHGGIARAGAEARPFRAWLDDWELRSSGPEADDPIAGGSGSADPPWLPLRLQARQDDFALRLALDSDRPLVLQGEEGFSRKHPNGGGSHYYSHPFLDARGELELAGERVTVSGQAWLDREWSSQFLQGDQAGWDWFALHLESGEKLMLFRLRATEAGGADFRHGVLISPAGETRALDPDELYFEPLDTAPVAGREIPVRWRVELKELERQLVIEALHPRQWMNVDFAYWEGYVTASGESPGESGRGYLEMVGYPRR